MELEEFKEKWNDIYYILNKHKFNDEKTLQQTLEDSILLNLGWKQSKGEVVRPEIVFGSASKGIPDAVLRKDGTLYLVIELKRLTTQISEKAEQQLFSYMQNLKLSFGILIGQTINLYYDNIVDKKAPIKIKTFELSENNVDTIELIKNLHKDNFSQENFENYCKSIITTTNSEKDKEEKIDFLCSQKGIDYVKSLLEIEYSKEVIDSLDIKITNKKSCFMVDEETLFPSTLITKTETKHTIKPVKIVDESYEIKPNEKVQDYVKRVLLKLEIENKLTENELKSMQDLEYSKVTFGLQFPLLTINNIYDACGHPRYWRSFPSKNKRYMNKFYVCSEWWLDFANDYVKKIAIWLNKILTVK